MDWWEYKEEGLVLCQRLLDKFQSLTSQSTDFFLYSCKKHPCTSGILTWSQRMHVNLSCVGLYDHLDDGLERHTRQIFTAELLKLWSIQSKVALSPKPVRFCCPTAVYFSTEKTVSKWMFRSFFVLCCCCPPQCSTNLNLLLSSLCSLAKSGSQVDIISLNDSSRAKWLCRGSSVLLAFGDSHT